MDRINVPREKEQQKLNFANALSDSSWKVRSSLVREMYLSAGTSAAMRNSVSIHVVSEIQLVRVVLVHVRVARFDGLLYAITLPGSQSASLSVRFKMGGRPSTPWRACLPGCSFGEFLSMLYSESHHGNNGDSQNDGSSRKAGVLFRKISVVELRKLWEKNWYSFC